jgi:hypothetical protein
MLALFAILDSLSAGVTKKSFFERLALHITTFRTTLGYTLVKFFLANHRLAGTSAKIFMLKRHILTSLFLR